MTTTTTTTTTTTNSTNTNTNDKNKNKNRTITRTTTTTTSRTCEPFAKPINNLKYEYEERYHGTMVVYSETQNITYTVRMYVLMLIFCMYVLVFVSLQNVNAALQYFLQAPNEKTIRCPSPSISRLAGEASSLLCGEALEGSSAFELGEWKWHKGFHLDFSISPEFVGYSF